MNKEHVLQVDSIIKTIGERKILSDIYLSCSTGEIVGLLGRNGSGKSTLMKIIFGSEATDDKSIRIDGVVYQHPYKLGHLIAYLPQNNFLPPSVTVKKIIRIYCNAHNRDKVLKDERISKLLHTKVAGLSGGELRYLEILLLLNQDLPFVFLDEPFSAIEPLYQDHIISMLQAFKHQKGIVITDHFYNKVIEVCDRLILLNNGKTQEIAAVTELEDYGYVPANTFTKKTASIVGRAAQSPFEIDKQTLKDLDLFNQGRRGAAFQLFNQVKTTGGGDKLESILKQPVADQQLLEARRDTILFFYKHSIHLPLKKQELEEIEHYLWKGLPLLSKNPVDAFVYGLQNKWKQSSGYYTISRGVLNLVALLKHLHDIGLQNAGSGTAPLLLSALEKVNELATAPEISRIIFSSCRKPLSAAALAKCDQFFRVEKKQLVRELLNLVYELDVYEAAATVAGKKGFCFPRYISSGDAMVNLTGLFNPLLQQPVPNDFTIDGNNNVCFITGSNMSGKSTFMKAFSLSILLSHVGFPVPATTMETTLFNGLITTINLSDNISLGYSHFYSEVKRIKDVAEKIKEKRRMIILFDELFRGTNVKDAADASLLVIDAFSKIEQCLFIISSHIVEIADELKTRKNIFFNRFQSELHGDSPVYSYKMNSGISGERFGLSIIRNEHIIEYLASIQKNSEA